MLAVTGVAMADRKSEEAAIRKALGGNEVSSIEPAPVDGFYEVVIGPHVVYVSRDARYLLQGELVDMRTRENLTAPRRQQAVRQLLDGLDKADMIVFSPDKPRHHITVFTDIDCGYCRKLHSQIGDYLAQGIEVRYLFYPRAGRNSPSYRKAVAVWCAKDRKQALTDAKNNKPIPLKTCDNPVDRHMQLARRLGLRGTPMIVLEDGSIQPGYVPPEPLAKLLDGQ
ncbi:MAG TPA: DsbC family protein [Gammaproteobacteria bacterium]|nr:DsbC family protein [Gammaproteobacteria bacterium]